MSNFEDPYDNTIWDPINPEHAVEDPMHGPSAHFNLWQTPAMPYGNGIYYQPGAYYSFHSSEVDANGQSIYTVGSMAGTSQILREAKDLADWVATYRAEGEDGLTRLEAERQRERLEKNGFVQAFKPTDVCGGGEKLDDCETAIKLRGAAQEYANTQNTERPGEGKVMSELAWLSKKCGACALDCSVAVQTNDGIPTGITRFVNSKPFESDFTVEV
jgi:hypothetical protein